MIPGGVPVTAIGVRSVFGTGIEALVSGIRSSRCPTRHAIGIGYPESPEPLVSGFPPEARPPGDQAAAERLLEAVDAMVHAWSGDPALLRSPDTALIVGTGGFLAASGAELHWRRSHPDASPTTPFRIRGPHWGASLVQAHLAMTGPLLTVTTGCSSGANALLAALDLLRRGRAARVVVIGVEELSAVTVSGFASLMLLDPQGCRPFDRERAGLQLGEAIAVVMLEPGHTGQAHLIAGANRCDTHHLTSAAPDGAVMRQVMEDALHAAGASVAEVVAIKAHGTGSVDSDRAEACALRDLFGPAALPVVALKRHLGHTLGACGVLEAVALAGCHAAGFLPASAGFANVDPELGLVPTREPGRARAGLHLLNFFGFGGNYTSLAVRFD